MIKSLVYKTSINYIHVYCLPLSLWYNVDSCMFYPFVQGSIIGLLRPAPPLTCGTDMIL